jgi:hypothetical protein
MKRADFELERMKSEVNSRGRLTQIHMSFLELDSLSESKDQKILAIWTNRE